MGDVILCNISDATKVIDEAKRAWIDDILLSIGITNLPLNDMREVRYMLDKHGVDIEYHSNGRVDVYKKQWNDSKITDLQGWLPAKKENLIAQWKEPKRIRKVDGNNVYYEIHINEWSFARR